MCLHRKTEHRADVFQLHANVIEHERIYQRMRAKRIRYSLQHQYLPLRRDIDVAMISDTVDYHTYRVCPGK
jgi:hypothetical protein